MREVTTKTLPMLCHTFFFSSTIFCFDSSAFFLVSSAFLASSASNLLSLFFTNSTSFYDAKARFLVKVRRVQNREDLTRMVSLYSFLPASLSLLFSFSMSLRICLVGACKHVKRVFTHTQAEEIAEEGDAPRPGCTFPSTQRTSWRQRPSNDCKSP